jgi:Transcriptional regulatory protein, C terminal
MTQHQTLRLVRAGTGIDDVELPGSEQDGLTGRLLKVIPIPETGMTMVIVAHLVAAPEGLPELSAPRPISPHDDEDGIRFDRAARRIWVDDQEVRLTFQEYQLLEYLTARPEKVISRPQLIGALWALETRATTRTVDVHIHRLRRKLGRYGRRLVTVWRVGYSYRPAEPE